MEALSRRTLFLLSNRRLSISPTLNLQIAHFSSNQSSSHYPSRRHDEEARNVRVSVWWDVETCDLPVGSSAYRITHSITTALRANGIKGPLQISAFGNVFKLPKWTQDKLSSTGINLTHVPSGGKNSVNRSMIIDIMYWVSQHPPPAHLFIISGDHDMASILHRLRMSNYNILLAGPEDASTALCSAVSIMWQWNNLVKGENLTGKHFNQPPDGPNGSWYGTYRVPLESPFPAVEQLMPTSDSEPVESETENTICDIPTEVTEQIRQILIAYPKGISITSLREELNNSMKVDKKLYGYKKFSNLLFAMPQILELRQHKDGQRLVCAVNPKAHFSADSPTEASVVGDSKYKTPLTQVEVCDDSSSLKSADEICTLNSRIITNETLELIEAELPSPSTCSEQPLLKIRCQNPSTNEKDVEATSSQGLAAIKKQDDASEDGIIRRTWTKWFGGSNDGDLMRERNHSVQHGPSSDSIHSCDTATEDPEMSENFDSGGKVQKFRCRVLNWFKTDRSETEPAVVGCYSSNVSSQVAQHSLRNNAFSKDGFWAEMKSFMRTPEGANVVSKSTSRLQMARALKNEAPSVLSSFGDDDLLHLVKVFIDEKKWIEECPSETLPFKVKCTSVSLPEKYNDPNALSSILSDKAVQSDLQKQIECGRKSTYQSPAPIASMESLGKRKTRMLADCQKLSDIIAKCHPSGYNIAGFKKLFFERFCYCLDVKSLEFDKLASLINTMSGVKLKGTTIFPSENSSSSTHGSSDAVLHDDINRINVRINSDNELCVPSTHSDDSSDSQFDEQLGPLRSLNRNMTCGPSGDLKPKTDKKVHRLYEPCVEEDIFTDSDGESGTTEGKAEGGVHNKVSTLIDILSNWEASKVGGSKSNLFGSGVKDSLQNPIKGEVSRNKSSRNIVQKWKPQRTFNFVSDDHRKEADLKSSSTEPRF